MPLHGIGAAAVKTSSMFEEYFDLVIQTHPFSGGGSKNNIRANPVMGQGLSTSLNVECSREMRYGRSATPHIYTSWQWPWREISPTDAALLIDKGANS